MHLTSLTTLLELKVSFYFCFYQASVAVPVWTRTVHLCKQKQNKEQLQSTPPPHTIVLESTAHIFL